MTAFNSMRRLACRAVACALLTGCWNAGLRTAEAVKLDTHDVVLDASNKLIPWTASSDEGYDRVMFLSWDLLLNRMPDDPANGRPVIFSHSEYLPTTLQGSDWPNNPAGKHAMLADAALLYYAYSGNTSVVAFVRTLLDHQLQSGTTPANYAWSRVPWSTGKKSVLTYGTDDHVEGVGILEPDKVGELGFHGYLRFYQLTGDTNYLNAALNCADALAARVRAGNATSSPWPFRVNAQTGATAYQEEYCANVIAPIRLFDELIRLGLGNTNAYAAARQLAWAWLMAHPMSNQVWANYFEDVSPMPNVLTNVNSYNPGQTTRYLLERTDLDPNWPVNASNLLQYVKTTFGGTDMGEAGVQFGARVISEQMRYKYKMASHTARYAANQALWFSRTGDPTAKGEAYRSLNWAAYMCRTNGVVIEGPAEFAQNSPCWFTDGHGDYVRHFMVAIGAVPEWAPPGQNHIVRSTSVIRSVNYGASNSVAYTTFDPVSTDTLRLAFTPGSVLVNGAVLAQRSDLSQPGWVFDATNSVLRIRHDAGTNVQVFAEVIPLEISTNALPIALAGVPYSATLTAVGGAPPYGWSVTDGVLPPGLTLNTNTGEVSGTPTNTVTAVFSFTMQARDASDPAGVATRSVSLTNLATLLAIVVTPANPTIPLQGSQQFAATAICSDGSTPEVTGAVTWSSSNSLVATVNAAGLASAVAPGVSSISAALAGVTGGSAITVSPPPLTVVTASLPGGTVGVAYSATLTATGGFPSYSWSIASGSLPAGLTLNTNSGSISGSPASAGNYFFTARVVDAANPSQVATQALALTVLQLPAFTGLIGNTNAGTASNILWSGGLPWIDSSRFQAASNMTVSAIRAQVTAITGRYKCALYAGTTFTPTTLLRSTVEITNAGDGWHTFPLTSSQVLTNGAYYWLAVWSDATNARAYYSSGSGTMRRQHLAYGVWPATAAPTEFSGLRYCIQAVGVVPTLTAVSVQPTNPVLVAGTTQQFTATASYSDGSMQNITSQAVWNSSNVSVAGLASNGLATSVSPGSTTISAALAGFIGSTTLKVPAPPVAFDQTLTGAEDSPLAITLTASHPDGSVTNFAVVGNPAHGTLSGTAPQLSYLPATNFFGADSFTFQVNDGSLTSAVATVTLALTNVNDPPVLPALPEARVGVFGRVMVTNTATDVDSPAEGLTYTLLSASSATISTNGVITWTPRTGPGTNRLITVVADDGEPPGRATNALDVVVTNAVERPVIQEFTVAGGVATAVWSAMSNGVYRLQGVEHAGNTNWLDLTPDVTATGTTAAAINELGSQPSRLYRVRVVP